MSRITLEPQKNYLGLNGVLELFNKLNSIKYAAYRTSSKLRVIQKILFMDQVSLNLIMGVFEKHQYTKSENFSCIQQDDAKLIISDIYYAVQKIKNEEINVNSFCNLLTSLVLHIYDGEGKNSVSVLSLKIFLTVLCGSRPKMKYLYCFQQLADENNCLSKKKLEVLLKSIIKVLEYIGEQCSFGSDLIEGTIESCFQNCHKVNDITEYDFISWLIKDPQLLVWLSTLYRIQISESASHQIQCKICKVFPIIGLRYCCLKCFSYNLCQSCFFKGKFNKNHKSDHPIQEFCYPMTTKQFTKTLLLTLKNTFCKNNLKLQYLPAVKLKSVENQQKPNDSSESFNKGSTIDSKVLADDSQLSSSKLKLGILSPIKDSSHSSLLNSDKKSREKSEKNLSWDNYDIVNYFNYSIYRQESRDVSSDDCFEQNLMNLNKKETNEKIYLDSWINGETSWNSDDGHSRNGFTWLRQDNDKSENGAPLLKFSNTR
ncbi:dystrophin, putative [Pediculus humanus corporis]|uniref:Dystrophin, putative n=1 Tax=Pediculus humanus subsp. corporis TaxID=121224 RepID=E0VQZ1_PEDHC|nr:dystrophin, putative [Pediculus humanus corporis]EEB15797.1 dystrophin, putative [Pediculus humanus corporis]